MPPAAAKAAGGPGGIIGALRPDWEEIKYAVMLTAARGQFSLPAWLALLLSTGNATLCERSTCKDTEWGGWDQTTDAYTGLKLLGRGADARSRDPARRRPRRVCRAGIQAAVPVPRPDAGSAAR